jgi:hypothetical protein
MVSYTYEQWKEIKSGDRFYESDRFCTIHCEAIEDAVVCQTSDLQQISFKAKIIEGYREGEEYTYLATKGKMCFAPSLYSDLSECDYLHKVL